MAGERAKRKSKGALQGPSDLFFSPRLLVRFLAAIVFSNRMIAVTKTRMTMGAVVGGM